MILFILLVVLFFFAWVPMRTWALYLAIMAIEQSRRGPMPSGKDFAVYLRDPYRWPTAWLVVRGVLYDWTLNIVPATVIFLDWPGELFFTERMERYVKNGPGTGSRLRAWRFMAGRAVCKHALDPYAASGRHCNC